MGCSGSDGQLHLTLLDQGRHKTNTSRMASRWTARMVSLSRSSKLRPLAVSSFTRSSVCSGEATPGQIEKDLQVRDLFCFEAGEGIGSSFLP